LISQLTPDAADYFAASHHFFHTPTLAGWLIDSRSHYADITPSFFIFFRCRHAIADADTPFFDYFRYATPPYADIDSD
jgi:hypothetical protein